MNVWLLPSAFFPHRGGVEELTLQLAHALSDRGHDVLVITNRHPPTLPQVAKVEGIRVRRCLFPSPRAAVGPAVRFPAALVSAIGSLASEGPRPDVIHVQCASVQLGAAAAVARLRRVPLVLTTQGEIEMDAERIFERSAYLRAVFRAGTRSAAALTACSRWAAESAVTLAPRFRSATVIPNGVNAGQWKVTPTPDEFVVGAWGRHVSQKGFDLLLAAWPSVRESLPTARLLIGGAGPETAALERAAGEGVEFLGALDRRGVQGLLGRSRIVVVPSRIEPFGIVALEAMAAGRGVVWSSRGGLIEATGGIGWGVDPIDRDSLARTLVTALRSRPEPKQYRRRAEEMSWNVLAERYLEIYDRVLA